MKIFVKRNKFLLISLLIIFLWVLISLIQYKFDFENLKESSIKNLEYCVQNHNDDFCDRFSVAVMPDTISIFFQLIINYSLRIFTFFVYPILIIISVTSGIYGMVKSGMFKNILTRMTYKNYISKVYLSSLKNLIILPFFLIILFVGSYILSGGNLTIPTEESSFISQEYLNNLVVFGLAYVLNIFLLNLFIINISYIFTIKCNHFVSAVIGSYLCFWIIWIILEAFVGVFVQNVFNVKLLTNSLNFSAFWVYDHVISLPFMVLFALSLVIVSTIGVYLIVRNKERVVLNAERSI